MKSNKKIMLGLISMMLILATISVAQALIADGTNLEVSLINQDPDPANPGEVIDLRFKVGNEGTSPTDTIYFEFLEDYPFSVYDGKIQQNIGSLQGWQKDEEGVIVLYKIKIDENAVQGTFYIDIRYKSGIYGSWTIIRDFPIRIRTRDIVLSIEDIKSTPDPIPPGSEFELSFLLKNNADSLVRDVTVKLGVSGTTIPIAPSSSTSEKQIYQINARNSQNMRFNLIALPDADGGVYKIPINISYTDETGEAYSKNDVISIKISSSPDLLITIDSSQIYGNVKSGEVVIKITNRGLTNIKLLSTKLLESKDFEITSEPEVYVGNIDSDDYETVDYKLNVKSYGKIVNLPLEISYKDSTNKEFSQKIGLVLRADSPSKAQTTVKGIINGIITIIVIVAVGLLIYKLYKRIKRRKKRQG